MKSDAQTMGGWWWITESFSSCLVGTGELAVMSSDISGLSQGTALSLNVLSRQVLPMNPVGWTGCSATSQCGGWDRAAWGREWMEKDGSPADDSCKLTRAAFLLL